MKKLVVLWVLSVTAIACQNNSETTTATTDAEQKTLAAESEVPTFRGEFIMVAEGAVLKGPNFIYGVAINEKANELAKRVAAVKKEEFDMVPVIVRGTLAPNPAEGWEQILTITEIMDVSDKPAAADIKIEEKKS